MIIYRLKCIPVPTGVPQGFQLVNFGPCRSVPHHAIYFKLSAESMLSLSDILEVEPPMQPPAAMVSDILVPFSSYCGKLRLQNTGG